MVEVMTEQGASQLVSEVVKSLPGGIPILGLWVVVGFFLLVTTMDSAAYTLAAASTIGLKATSDPSKNTRLFWALMLAVSPLALFYAGQFIEGGIPLGGLQATLILTAIPVSFLMLAVMYSGIKWVKEDYGHKTKAEIIEEFRTAEEQKQIDDKRMADATA